MLNDDYISDVHLSCGKSTKRIDLHINISVPFFLFLSQWDDYNRFRLYKLKRLAKRLNFKHISVMNKSRRKQILGCHFMCQIAWRRSRLSWTKLLSPTYIDSGISTDFINKITIFKYSMRKKKWTHTKFHHIFTEFWIYYSFLLFVLHFGFMYELRLSEVTATGDAKAKTFAFLLRKVVRCAAASSVETTHKLCIFNSQKKTQHM